MTPAPWLRNVWYAAMWAEALAPQAPAARTILNEHVVFFRDAGGKAAAMIDRCPHRFAPLHLGTVLSNGRLQCGYHGLEFDADGKCVLNPHGDGKIPPAAVVRAFPVIEKHTLLWIWLGDAPADPALIPDYSVFEGAPPLHVTERGDLVLEADYKLITDNLLDLSHASYLHPGTLGNVEMASVTKTEVTQSGNTVTVSRRSPNVPIPGIAVRSYGWNPPGNMLLEQGVCEPGAAESTGTGYYGVHILTPETECTTHYLFSAVRFNVRETDPNESAQIRDEISKLRRAAFELQDGPVIKEQARVIAEMGENAPRPALLAIDAGAVRFRRVLDTLIAQESTSA
jgi:vanillate O-demethylase monooxygenase subunit